MSRKQRVLASLQAVASDLRQAEKAGNKAALTAIARDLAETREACRQGLPGSSYAMHGEIYDGLILAARQMSEGEGLDREALALCRELVQHLVRETERETSFKKDMVFLPYKASMWDSLESVWKAACEDKEHCNAYVMPIPYADLNPDQSVAAWHCERELFPKYVPTLDWQAIDLKAWHPDIIFIHNPYDNCNLVTSVDSRYYSRNLKECADKLVYIPYFVLQEPCTEESVEHFVATPGVLNADKVIVQSEAMRERYINILTRATNRPDRSYWEGRISGAGSPKIDKVLTSKKEDFDMPEQWRKLIAGRKVILYNTSLSAMLDNSDKVCAKLRYVFDVFRNRDDVALWWRPHPLMKATIHSMRPQIEEEYLGIEKQYIEEGWGIYDDSPDLHRAICWSDAYYGDGSSVVVLYAQTGKSILLQTFADKSNPFVYYGKPATDGERMWYIPEIYPAIVEVDLKAAHISNVFNLPLDCRYQGGFLGYRNLEKIGKKLYAIPMIHNDAIRDIFEFDITTQKFEKIDVPDELFKNAGIRLNQESSIFYCSSYKEKNIYMYGVYPIIVRYNVQLKEFKVFCEWDGLFDEKNVGQWFANHGIWHGENLVIPIFQKRFVLIFDTATEMFSRWNIPADVANDYGLIGIYNNIFWIMAMDSPYIISCNLSNGQTKQYQLCSNGLKERFWGKASICFEKNVWIFPYQSGLFINIDMEHEEVKENRFLPVMNVDALSNMFYANYPGYACKHKKKAAIIHPDNKELIVIDENNKFDCTKIDISKDVKLKFDMMAFSQRGDNTHNEISSKDIVRNIQYLMDQHHDLRKNMDSNCGNRVIRYLHEGQCE